VASFSSSIRHVGYLDDLGTIQTVPDTLPHNLSWEDNILQDAIVDSSQSPGARALNSWTLLGRPHNPPCGNNYHILWHVRYVISILENVISTWITIITNRLIKKCILCQNKYLYETDTKPSTKERKRNIGARKIKGEVGRSNM
jgi:hypothetical protein